MIRMNVPEFGVMYTGHDACMIVTCDPYGGMTAVRVECKDYDACHDPMKDSNILKFRLYYCFNLGGGDVTRGHVDMVLYW